MFSNFKRFLILASVVAIGCTSSFGQDSEKDDRQHKVFVQLKPSITFPTALGNNFLGEAYNLKPGFLGNARVFIQDEFFLGIHGNFLKADVADITLVGDFERANIWHNYLTGGYLVLPRNSKFGLDVGAGLGLAVYANRKEDVRFREEGFSLMACLNVNYRFSPVIGVGFGVQYAHDFLATKTAPELEKFFKNANIIYLSVGLVFYINQ